MKITNLILGLICTNLIATTNNTNSVSNDNELISKICETNNISYSNNSDSFTIENNNQKSSYKYSDDKLTQFDFYDKANLKNIQNTYTYDGSNLIYALTNGQTFEKKKTTNDNNINFENYYINNELLECKKYDDNSQIKEFSNRQTISTSKNDNVIIIDNGYDTKSLLLDDNDNILQEYSDCYSIKNEYQGNLLVSKNYDSFSYIKNDEKETYKYNNNASVDVIEYNDDNYCYTINKDTFLVKDKLDYYSIDIDKNNITYCFNETSNDYNTKYVNQINFNGNTLFSYKYDNNGNIINENYLNTDTNYSYDSKGQLISCQSEKNIYTYSYDERGNLIKETSNGKEINFQYKNDLLTYFENIPLTYDAYGNLLSFNNIEFTYKSGNKLSTYKNGNSTIKYDYDSNGLRLNKSNNNEETKYFYVENKLIYESNDSNYVRYFYDKNDNVLGFEYKNENYFYIKDCVDCIRKIIDSNGNTLVDYTYDPWGNILSIEDTSENQLSNINHILYKGYVYDFDSNLYYLISRYYSPILHRFITIDNLELISSGKTIDLNLNLYTYSDNNPIMKKDSLGYFAATIAVGTCVISISTLIKCLIGIILICSTMIIVNKIISTMNASGLTAQAKTALNNSKDNLKKVIDELNSIAKGVFGTWLLTRWRWWDNIYRNQTEIHHIIAQGSIHHALPRIWLKYNYQGNINVKYNLVEIKKLLHKHLHTTLYYKNVRLALEPFCTGNKEGFFAVLASIKIGIISINGAIPD